MRFIIFLLLVNSLFRSLHREYALHDLRCERLLCCRRHALQGRGMLSATMPRMGSRYCRSLQKWNSYSPHYWPRFIDSRWTQNILYSCPGFYRMPDLQLKCPFMAHPHGKKPQSNPPLEMSSFLRSKHTQARFTAPFDAFWLAVKAWVDHGYDRRSEVFSGNRH